MKLEVRAARCGYPGGPAILEQVSFTVETGEICCLLGPNGAGKTTLFKSLLGLLKLQGGEIRIDGEDISRWSPRRMAQTAAYVSQLHVPPFPYLVKDVVLLGRVPSTGYFGQPGAMDREIAEQAMEDMGVIRYRDTPYTDLSGGERQLVMIARALAQEPALLVLDEPTASLDYGNMIRVMEKIRALKERGYAVVMTTHLPDQAFLCGASVVLLRRDGPLLFGPAEQVVTEKNLQEAYGVRVKIMEFAGADGHVRRLCAPLIDET